MTPSLNRFRALAQRICSTAAMERLIDPAIADLQHEYDDAVRHGSVWRSRWVRIAGCIAVLKVALVAVSTMSTATSRERPAEDHAVSRTIGFSLVAMAVMTILLVSPALRQASQVDAAKMNRAIWFLTPQALAIALPLGLMFGILLGLRDRVPTARVKWIVVALGIACSAAAFVIVGWLLPSANQAFRELMAGGRIMRGLNELTLGELGSRDPAQLVGESVTPRRLAWAFHCRIALAFAPLTLSLFSLSLTGRRRKSYGPVVMCLSALTLSFGYYTLMFYAREAVFFGEWLPALAAGWAPDGVFLTAALLLLLRETRSPDVTLG